MAVSPRQLSRLAEGLSAGYGARMTEHDNISGNNSGGDHPGSDRAALLALLQWYRAAGVEDAVSDSPTNWIARGDEAPLNVRDLGLSTAPGGLPPATGRQHQSEAPGSPVLSAKVDVLPEGRRVESDRVAVSQGAGLQGTGSQATGAATRAFTVTAPEIARADARAAAASANSLADLRDRLEAFEGCGLKATAKNLCLFRGSEAARVMIIGEAPGRDEDQDGRPFVGRAGQLLDKMLAAIGLGEPDVHITNVVYWRPPGNRTPTPLEVEVCRPFLDRQIELVRPDVVLSLGGPAAKALLDTSSGIMKVRGKWQDIEASGRQIKIMPTLHPAYLLRTPAAKRLAWRDLLAVKAVLDGG